MEIKEVNTYWARIYIAGPIKEAEQILRRECFKGLCVNIYPNKYIYKAGEEVGYVVELINYPRFPVDDTVLFEKAKDLASTLMVETYQGSFTIMCPDKTVFISRRDW